MRCYMFLLCITNTRIQTFYFPFIFGYIVFGYVKILNFLEVFSELSRFHGIHPHRYTRSYLLHACWRSHCSPWDTQWICTKAHHACAHHLWASEASFAGLHLPSPPKYSKVLQSTRHATNTLRIVTWSYVVIYVVIYMVICTLCTYCTWYWVQQCHCSSWGQEMSGFTKATKAFTQASDALLAWNSEFHR